MSANVRLRDGKIPLDECVDGWYYKVHGRGISSGVFVKDISAFIGIRQSFWECYLTEEDHWDKEDILGTVVPYEKICVCPIRPIDVCVKDETGLYVEHDELFAWLDKQESRRHIGRYAKGDEDERREEESAGNP